MSVGIVLFGAGGRMAGAVDRAAAAAGDVRIKARFGRPRANRPAPAGWEELELPEPIRRGDVVVDFSSPEGTISACHLCTESGAALVSGTTGLGPDAEARLAETARKVAVLRASNFSLGVLALRRAIRAALETLPGGWDVEIVERHHRLKTDAPSGTALTLARDVAERRGLGERAFRNGRAGAVGARPADEIGIHAVRGGTWVGDHTVLVAGEGEWLELRHVAQDRSAFAHGVLEAVRFVAHAAPGMYHLEHLATGGRSI